MHAPYKNQKQKILVKLKTVNYKLKYIFAAKKIEYRMKILMVCHGNICRSPLAEGILQHKAKMAGLNWQVESAGTTSYHTGDEPHCHSQKVARINGIDISDQCAQQFKKEDMLKYDKIYVMDSENYIDVKRMSKELWNEERVELLLNELYPGKNIGVPDPWYGEEDGYHEVFRMISEACDAIIEKASENLSKREALKDAEKI